MNIFFTSVCPAQCAAYLDDKRVVKMCLETTQMLCTALNEHGCEAPYKSTHVNHPSNVWARQTRKNWLWLHEHGIALCKEYTRRYDKVHKCEGILNEIKHLAKQIPIGEITPFANCAANQSVGVDFKHIEPVTEAYKQYLCVRWENDKREPTWYKETR